MEKENMYCGVDLHYGKSVFCFVDEQGNVKEQVETNTKKKDIEELLQRCQGFRVNYAFEAGGMARYFYKLVKGMENTEKIHVVHPYKFKIITESKNKNDKADSKKLARALQKDYLPYPVHIKSDRSRHLQVYLGLRKRRVTTRSKIINQAKSIIRGLGIKTSTKSLKSNQGFTRAVELLKEDNFEQEIMKSLQMEFCAESGKIEEVEAKIQFLIKKEFNRDYELLETIPGIGPVGAATILSVIDDIKRFKTAREYSSYCGLVPSEHSSGDKIVHGRITKEGPTNLRTLYIQAAWSLIRSRSRREDPRLSKLKRKYYRISVRGKNAQRAVVAVARHLSRISFGVLKHQEEYCGEIKDTKRPRENFPAKLEENKTQAC